MGKEADINKMRTGYENAKHRQKIRYTCCNVNWCFEVLFFFNFFIITYAFFF